MADIKPTLADVVIVLADSYGIPVRELMEAVMELAEKQKEHRKEQNNDK